jgi:hypothetical protein
MTDAKLSFNDAITKLLNEKLKIYHNKNLDLVLCTEIYQTIFSTLVEVFKSIGDSKKLTNESMNFIAQQYYDSISINGHEELNPNIFTQRAKLENIETKELALVAMMLFGTDFSIPVLKEIKRRS